MATREDLFMLLDARDYMWSVACAEIAGFFPVAIREMEHFVATKHNVTSGRLKTLSHNTDLDTIEFTVGVDDGGELLISIPVNILTLSSEDGNEGVITNYLNVTPSAVDDTGSGQKTSSDVRKALEDVQRAFPEMFIDYDRLEEVEEDLKGGKMFRGYAPGVLQ